MIAATNPNDTKARMAVTVPVSSIEASFPIVAVLGSKRAILRTSYDPRQGSFSSAAFPVSLE
jgi:hypothetical protein